MIVEVINDLQDMILELSGSNLAETVCDEEG